MKTAKSSSAPARAAKTFRLAALALLLVLLNLPACKKDADFLPEPTQIPATDAEDREILRFLNAAGIDPDQIEFRPDYVFDGDAGWERAALLKTIREKPFFDPSEILLPEDTAAVDRQRGIPENRLTQAVTATNVQAVKFYIRPSVVADCGVAWAIAVRAAALAWNDVENCRVVLVEVPLQSIANIVIGSDADSGLPAAYQNMPGNYVALGAYPAAGKAGRWISINDDYDDWDSKLKTAMHELGHNLGYRHTGSEDGIHLHGTLPTDPGSIMNLGPNTAPAFTWSDIRAIRMYYPEGLVFPTGFSATRQSAGRVRISYYLTFPDTSPYYWARVEKFSVTGQFISQKFFRAEVPPNGTQIISWGGHAPGICYFRVSGCNFRRDVSSPASPLQAVAL